MTDIGDLLAKETALVAAFIAVLGEEQLALTHGDIEPLAGLAQRKATLADELNALELARNTQLAAAGHATGRAGMESWLQANPGGTLAGECWLRLLKLAGEAKAMNVLNGKLITLRLNATSQALATLTRQAQQTGLYGPDGQTAQHTGSRIIDAA